MAPALQIAALSSDKLTVLSGPPSFGKEVFSGAKGTVFEYAHSDGSFVQCDGPSISFCTDIKEKPVRCEAEAPVARVLFSPTGKYCATQEPTIDAKAQAHKNLKIWRTSDGELVASFHKKGITDDTWPALQFDAAETHVFFTVKDAIVLYDMSGDMKKAVRKVKMEGVNQFQLSPGKRKVVATFVPESAKPAVFALAEWEEGGITIQRKQFFRATRCKFAWNAGGTHCLCQSISDFDATNQSYFGESRLYLLSVDGRTDVAITLEGDANIVDVAWSPGGDDFVALGGHQPTTAYLYDKKGKPVCKIGTGAFNLVRWSDQGRFFLLAGFGNLPGDIQTFEREGADVRAMGALRSECSVMIEWSPCARFFLTASVAPRMRVDNRITVFTYFGEKVANLPFDELRAAHWKPLPAADFPDRGVSPERQREVAANKKKGVNLTAPPKKMGYVPPHERGPNGAKEREIAGFDADEAASRIRNIAARRASNRTPEGAEVVELTKNQLKNQKKKAAKAKAKADDDGGGDAAEPSPEPIDPVKRLRNLRKRLTKVEAAKEKKAKGEALTPEQEESVADLESLLEEMRGLGATDV